MKLQVKNTKMAISEMSIFLKKFISLQNSRVRRLYDDSFHEWNSRHFNSFKSLKISLAIPLDFILTLDLKDMLNRSHITIEIFRLARADIFRKTRVTILHPFSEFMV